ncbi:MAG: efflux RND transporter periplasmic adaptor subunit [Bauldia sp.]|uniref:efflux RND transporter periplasmic adaptor subunit n=1 Tax=Bauldia sp. TaxID=2575872 RepID=UPI001D94CC6A|nr:efflux RND transporter periplasmic adaptor subunit [Bauldia sp.]MCB1497917.1 efflux RND transporter periplasmic adaptor subunit [Bauldia sp.]
MASMFKPSRIISVLLVAGAAAWILSGDLNPAVEEPTAEPPPTVVEEPQEVATRVSVVTATPEDHQRQITLSCTTEADHQSVAVARGAGVIIALNVERGSKVRSSDVIAEISDEGREAAVKQAKALLEQRRAEYEARKKLIDKGNAPKNDLPALEAAVAAAEAALANAEAEADRSKIRSPIDGVVNSVPVQVGQAIQAGTTIAEVIDPDPMLAVGAVSERERGQLAVGQSASVRFIDGLTVDGKVSYLGLSADDATRTYPVEAHMANRDSRIPDGVSCELTVDTKPVPAASVPRSALVFSDKGELGIRIADDESRVRFVPVSIVDDGREDVWVTGIDGTTRVIVVGQEFVKDGDLVEPVSEVAAVE